MKFKQSTPPGGNPVRLARADSISGLTNRSGAVPGAGSAKLVVLDGINLVYTGDSFTVRNTTSITVCTTGERLFWFTEDENGVKWYLTSDCHDEEASPVITGAEPA